MTSAARLQLQQLISEVSGCVYKPYQPRARRTVWQQACHQQRTASVANAAGVLHKGAHCMPQADSYLLCSGPDFYRLQHSSHCTMVCITYTKQATALGRHLDIPHHWSTLIKTIDVKARCACALALHRPYGAGAQQLCRHLCFHQTSLPAGWQLRCLAAWPGHRGQDVVLWLPAGLSEPASVSDCSGVLGRSELAGLHWWQLTRCSVQQQSSN